MQIKSMDLPFCSKCGAKLDAGNKSKYCPVCKNAEEKYGLYKEVFRAKRTVYIAKNRSL